MKSYVAQGIAATTANLAMFSSGMLFGWPSPSLPKLMGGEDELRLTSDEAAWTISVLSFGCIFGPLLANHIVDRIGRKWSLNLATVPVLISWVIVGLASNVETLYVGRFIGGLAVGASYSLMPMYLGEIAEDRIRGGLGTLMLSMLNLGMLLTFSTGPWVSRQVLSIIGIIPPLLFLLIFFWIPETPYYLLMKNKQEEALESLTWFRQEAEVAEELNDIRVNVEKQSRNDASILELVKSPGNRRALFITGGMLLFQQFSGVIAIQSYASIIFEQSGFAVSSSVSVIIMGIAKMVAAFLCFFIIDILGRRPILMFSAIFAALPLLAEAVFFHLKHLNVNLENITWLPLTGVMVFYVMYSVGFGAIPYTVISEVFPTNVKAKASMVLSMYGSALAMIIGKLYQVVSDEFGVHVVFYGFGLITLFGSLFVYFCVPETKQRSLQDIQDKFNKVDSGKR